MQANPTKLLDEILKETRNYRCEYLQVLVEKYVNTQDEVLDIHLRNFAVTKPIKNLKRLKEKPFGYVSSYECKSAKKSIKYWKKSIILEKRVSFRKYVGALPSTDHSTNLKYLSTNKAYKAVLSAYSDKSYEECESTLLNETELRDDDDEETITFAEENETILSNEDNSVLPGTVKFPLNKRQNKISGRNEPIKTVTTTDKYLFPTCNIEELSNFQIKNCHANLLKSSNHKKLDLLIENISTAINNSISGKTPKIECKKLSVFFKGISSPESKDERDSACSVYNSSNGMSFLDYVASKSTPKFKFSDFGLGISNKNNKISSFCDTKSLPCALSKSTEISEVKHGKYEKETFNKNCLVSSDYAQSVSSYSTDIPKSKSENVEVVISDKNCQSSYDDNSKSLSYASNKSSSTAEILLRKDKVSAYNKKYLSSSDTNSKSLSYASNNDMKSFNLRPRKNGQVISAINCQTSSDYNVKSSYSSSKSTQASKLRSGDDEKVVSKKNFQSSSDCNFQSLSGDIKDSLKNSKPKPKEQTSNDNWGVFNNCNSESLFYASNKPFKNSNSKYKESEKLPTNKNYAKYNFDESSSPSKKRNEIQALKSKEDGIATPYEICQSPRKNPSKLSALNSTNCNQASKSKSKNDKTFILNKNDQTCSSYNTKSIFVSDKPVQDTNLKPKEDGKKIFNDFKNSNSNCKENEKLPSNKYCDKSVDDKSSSDSKHPNEIQTLKSKEDKIIAPYEICQSSRKIPKLLASDSTNSNQASKSKCKDETFIVNKNDQTFSSYNTKSLFLVSGKSVQDTNLKSKEDGKKMFNDNRKMSNDCNSEASSKSVVDSTLKQNLDKKLISDDKNYKKSNNCSTKLLPNSSCYKAHETQKPRCKESEKTSHKNCQVSLDISGSELSSCNSNKCIPFVKTKSEEETSEQCLEISSVKNVKSSTSDKFANHSEHKYSDVGTRPSNRNSKILLNSFPLRCTSLSSSFASNFGVSAEIDPLSQKSFSEKKKSSQSSLKFKKTKSYKHYLEDSIKVDDLLISKHFKRCKNKKKDYLEKLG